MMTIDLHATNGFSYMWLIFSISTVFLVHSNYFHCYQSISPLGECSEESKCRICMELKCNYYNIIVWSPVLWWYWLYPWETQTIQCVLLYDEHIYIILLVVVLWFQNHVGETRYCCSIPGRWMSIYSRFQVVCPIMEKWQSKLTNEMQAIPKYHQVHGEFDCSVCFFIFLRCDKQPEVNCI